MSKSEIKIERKWELWNTITHFSGVILALLGMVFMLSVRTQFSSKLQFYGVIIYLVAVLLLFLCSTMLHGAKYKALPEKPKHMFTLFDYSAIYVLIAGTYTPFIITVYLQEPQKMLLWLGLIWSLAIFGVVYQLLFNGKHKLFSTLLYIFLGWIIMFMIKPVVAMFPFYVVILLVIGGVLYTSGTIFFSMKKPQMHTVWHLFVLAGSLCMFIAVAFTVL